MSLNNSSGKPFEYKDGLAFRYEMPEEGLALRAVYIEDGVPKLHFTASKKVPTITEEDVAICIRLSHDHKRPEFFYHNTIPQHPLATIGRHYKHYKPTYLRRTSVGELLAEVDWQMKCLNVDVRSDKNRETFHSWSKSSNLNGFASWEKFPVKGLHGRVVMTCQSVDVCESENQLAFVGEPKMKITDTRSEQYTNYITNNFDSIAYHDEPSFLKVKEIIKLMLAAEWLRDKGVQFSREWIEGHSSIKREAPKPVQVQLSPEETDYVMKVFQEGMAEGFNALNKALNPEQSQSPLSLRFAVKEPNQDQKKDVQTGIEYSTDFALNLPHLPPELQMRMHVVARVTINDFDFLCKGLDPNMPVIADTNDGNIVLLRPEVDTWSDLYRETEPLPCKWIQDPNNPLGKTPTLNGGVSTATIPVTAATSAVATVGAAAVSAAALLPTVTTGVINIAAAAAGLVKGVSHSDIPEEAEIPEPPTTLPNDYPFEPAAEESPETMYGFVNGLSKFGMSDKDSFDANLPLYCMTETAPYIGDKQVGPARRVAMNIGLPSEQDIERGNFDKGQPILLGLCADTSAVSSSLPIKAPQSIVSIKSDSLSPPRNTSMKAIKSSTSPSNSQPPSNVSIKAIESHVPTGDTASPSNVSIKAIESHVPTGDTASPSNVSIKAIESHVPTGDTASPSNVSIKATKSSTPTSDSQPLSNVSIKAPQSSGPTSDEASSNVSIRAHSDNAVLSSLTNVSIKANQDAHQPDHDILASPQNNSLSADTTTTVSSGPSSVSEHDYVNNVPVKAQENLQVAAHHSYIPPFDGFSAPRGGLNSEDSGYTGSEEILN